MDYYERQVGGYCRKCDRPMYPGEGHTCPPPKPPNRKDSKMQAPIIPDLEEYTSFTLQNWIDTLDRADHIIYKAYLDTDDEEYRPIADTLIFLRQMQAQMAIQIRQNKKEQA